MCRQDIDTYNCRPQQQGAGMSAVLDCLENVTRNGMFRAGSGVVRMDPLRFLAGCRTRRLNQA